MQKLQSYWCDEENFRPIVRYHIPYSKKLWRSKSLAKRVTARNWRKKLWQMLTCIANHRSTVNNAIPNIDEHNKTNSVLSRIWSVLHASTMLFDDGKVHCRVYDLWLSLIYVYKLLLESELDPQYGNIDIIPGSGLCKTNKAQLMFLHAPHVTKTGKLVKKVGKLL